MPNLLGVGGFQGHRARREETITNRVPIQKNAGNAAKSLIFLPR
jgi:hypothetical protein